MDDKLVVSLDESKVVMKVVLKVVLLVAESVASMVSVQVGMMDIFCSPYSELKGISNTGRLSWKDRLRDRDTAPGQCARP